MAINPKFILKDANSEKETSIKFYFYLDKQRFTYSLGPDKMIYPALWDKIAMRPKSKPSKTLLSRYGKINPTLKIDLTNLNTRIENVVSETMRYLSNAEIQGSQVDFNELREHLNTSFDLKPKIVSRADSDNLELFLADFIKGMESGARLITSRTGEGRRYRKGTVKAYKVLESKLSDYRDGKRKKYLKFSDIDIDFYNEFQQMIYAANYTPNYFGNFIKNLKAVMKRSHEEGLHNNTDYAKKAFKKTTNETTSIYLTEKELSELYEHDFSGSRLEKYRDVFLIGCWTAQRFSDYSRISKEYIKEKEGIKVVEFNQVKTNTKVVVPLRPEALELLAKYGYSLPKLTEQKMNDALKDIGELLEFDEMIEVQKIKGGKEITKMVPKYKMMSTHCARRTGCTLMYLNKIPMQDIMKISGHKTEVQLLKYIKVTKEETAQRLSMNPFFSGQKLVVV